MCLQNGRTKPVRQAGLLTVRTAEHAQRVALLCALGHSGSCSTPRQVFTCWGSDCPKLLSPVSGVFVGSCLLGLVSCPFILPPWSLFGAPSALSLAHKPPALTAAASVVGSGHETVAP